jgi:Protein of unknown function (DUF559)
LFRSSGLSDAQGVTKNRFPTGTISSSPPSRFGLTTRAELLASGLTRGAVSRRVARGALVRRYPGVYSFGPGELSFEAQAMAAVLAADGVLSHRPAGTLLRVSRLRSALPHVLVVRRHHPIEGIVLHECRSLDPRDVTVCRGIPVTTVPRMCIDLADDHTVWQVANVMHEAAFRNVLNIAAVRHMLERSNGRRGVALVERAIALHLAGSAGTKSTLEDTFLALAAKLPEPLVNMELEGLEVDCQWPEQRLVVEVDGPGHLRPAVKREDARRDRLLVAAGHRVMRVTDVELEREPDRVLARLLRRF